MKLPDQLSLPAPVHTEYSSIRTISAAAPGSRLLLRPSRSDTVKELL